MNQLEPQTFQLKNLEPTLLDEFIYPTVDWNHVV